MFNSGPRCSSPVSRPQSRKLQPPGEQCEGIAVPELRGGGKPPVKLPADNPVMVDQPQRLVGDELFELIFARAGARDVGRAGFCRNMVSPVPAPGVIVD